MGIIRRYWELIKLVFRYIQFKVRQSRLKTNDRHIITTSYGPIRGVKRISIWNDSFWSFEKIPFAKPPLGELRFKAPEPPDPWHMILDCTKEGNVPLQTNIVSKRIEGSEDCLYLNVYSKNLNPREPMPVMVWIYGGGFENGGATKDLYSPDYFMQKDVVLITINYRVGPFGFMSFDDPDLNIPGNAGLKDQVLALKWIKLNCVYFGGNPENITIFGESAGGASTHYMMLTERTKDLFHRAILMSGTSLCPWALNKCPNRSYRLAKAMGYEGENNDKLIFEYLKCAKGSQFLKGEKHVLTSAEKKKLILFPFGPVIEPYDSSHCVIPEDPRIMMRKAWSNQIPIIIGGTSDEGLLFYLEVKTHPQILKKLNNCTNLVPNDLNLNENSSELLDYGLKLRKMYFKDMEPKIENLHQYLELLSDKIFWHSIHRTILSRLIYASNASTYLYRFDVDSPYFNWLRSLLCGPKKRGVCHADDLGYLFLNMWSPMLSKNSQEYFAIQELISSFVSFAKYGNPNINSSFKSTIKWEPLKKLNNINDDYFNDLSMLCLNYNFNTKIIDLPEYQKFKLWDSFYPKEMLV